MENSIKNLKRSVLEFEQIEQRLKGFESNPNVNISDVNTKLFFDEFFDTSTKDVLPPEFKQYDLMQNAANEEFLASAFKNPPVIMPIQNLGEIAFILGKMKEAMALLDISLKLYKIIDPENLLKFKNLTLLGAILDQQNQTPLMHNIFKSMLKQLENVDGTETYEKLFVIRNYGYLLARNEQTKLEGEDYIKRAD